MILQSSSPILSNDAQGWITFLAVVVAVIGSMVGAVVILAKRGDREAIRAVDMKVDAFQGQVMKDLNNIGSKFNGMELEAEKAHAELRTEIKGINSTLEGYHREQLTLIMDMSRAHTNEVHKVDRQVGILMERSNLVDCINQLGAQIAKAIKEK